jgi:hypothetical protein
VFVGVWSRISCRARLDDDGDDVSMGLSGLSSNPGDDIDRRPSHSNEAIRYRCFVKQINTKIDTEIFRKCRNCVKFILCIWAERKLRKSGTIAC